MNQNATAFKKNAVMSILKFEYLTGKEPYIDSKLKLQNYDPLIYSLFKLNVQTASIHYFTGDETPIISP